MSLLDKVTCPHCWEVFETHLILWISTHPSLVGDPRIREAQKRFLPTRFNAEGLALDEMNSPCHRLACPKCHLEIPRVFTEMNSWIVSIIGAPAAGKSFYLSALAHTLRDILPSRFEVSFTDSDPLLNRKIIHYEQSLFGNSRSGTLTPLGELIEKTQQGRDGDVYNFVRSGSVEIQYPRPYMFNLCPKPNHPRLEDSPSAAHVLCLYDNAGESYLTGSDSTLSPVTRHLAHASLLLFLFDPTQDHNFRQGYLNENGTLPTDERIVLRQQQTILTEAANRIRQLANLSTMEKHNKPLFVVVTKKDLWGHLVPAIAQAKPLLLTDRAGVGYVNVDHITAVSDGIREMLLKLCPGMVDAAETFAQSVIYVGVSSLGAKPTMDDSQWCIRPNEISPVGVEAPILYGLNKLLPGLFPSGRKLNSRNLGQ